MLAFILSYLADTVVPLLRRMPCGKINNAVAIYKQLQTKVMLWQWPSRQRPQVARPSVEQASENLVPRSVPTIAYRLPPPDVQTVVRPTAAEHSAVRASAGASNPMGFFLPEQWQQGCYLLVDFFT